MTATVALTVIPLKMSGLRCGSYMSAHRRYSEGCHPAQNERAPLRHLIPAAVRGVHLGVIPLKMSGLRCGNQTLVYVRKQPELHPPQNDRAPLQRLYSER